jgi:hypothetical protein
VPVRETLHAGGTVFFVNDGGWGHGYSEFEVEGRIKGADLFSPIERKILCLIVQNGEKCSDFLLNGPLLKAGNKMLKQVIGMVPIAA